MFFLCPLYKANKHFGFIPSVCVSHSIWKWSIGFPILIQLVLNYMEQHCGTPFPQLIPELTLKSDCKAFKTVNISKKRTLSLAFLSVCFILHLSLPFNFCDSRFSGNTAIGMEISEPQNVFKQVPFNSNNNNNNNIVFHHWVLIPFLQFLHRKTVFLLQRRENSVSNKVHNSSSNTKTRMYRKLY